MRRSIKASNLGLITALLGGFVYLFASGYEIEESLGLNTLFKLRGSIATPNDSVVVAVNKMSSDYFGLENDVAKWPREYHAKLIDILKSHGAKAIVFDVFFKEPGSKREDKKLAAAIKNAGNVVLFSHLKRQILSHQGNAPGYQELNKSINIERLIYPTDTIAKAPVALAPFALLKYPQQVNKFWTFRVPAGEIPNLPVVAFQLATIENYSILRQLIQQTLHSKAQLLPTNVSDVLQKQQLTDLVSELRLLFKANPDLASKILQLIDNLKGEADSVRASLTALVNLYHGPNQYYLNFYGPPRSITTIPYHEILSIDKRTSFDVKGKVVFVGFSEYLQPEQKDNFYTVFSQTNGLDISGVEIAATAFSNLKNSQGIKTLSPFVYISLILLYGFVIAFVSRYLNTLHAVFAALAIMGCYSLLSYWFFLVHYLWLPWVVPILIQSPFALFIALLWHYTETRREREQIRKAFGYFLPSNVVNKIAQNAGHIDAQQQQMYGICLATDAAQYTSMAENMQPEDLSLLVNRYYEKLFEPVRRHGGIVSDVIGDAMLAIWSSPQSDVELRTQACLAALEIDTVMNGENTQSESHLLPTRIGLHAGELMLGNIGAGDHFEYRAVGDIVNTSNRIESLNKRIGCKVIASANVVQDVTGIVMRSLGKFRLPGKQQILHLYELLCRENVGECEKYHIQIKERCEMLEKGVRFLQGGDLKAAIEQFTALANQYSNDKAAQYYLKYCELMHKKGLPEDWAGVIELNEK